MKTMERKADMNRLFGLAMFVIAVISLMIMIASI